MHLSLLIRESFNQLQEKIKIDNEEFDPGSGRTLAACLTHASQGERESSDSLVNWRTGE